MPSQLGADAFVLTLFPQRAGFFVDVGAADGTALSNTAALEQQGWGGVAIDPLLANFEDRPRTRCIRAACFSSAGQDVEFVICKQDPNLSGIATELNTYKDCVLSAGGAGAHVVHLQTVLLGDLLDQVGAPKQIEYLNLDTEGSELAILSSPGLLDRYTFGALTVEHNYEEPKRSQIRQLLQQRGYVLAAEVRWDDWYVHGSLAGALQQATAAAPVTSSARA